MALKRNKAFEFTIERGKDMAKINRKYRQLRDDGKSDIRIYIFYYFELVDRINKDDNSSTNKNKMALI